MMTMTMTMKMNSIEISCRSDSRIVSLLLFFGIFFIKSKRNSRTALTQAKIMNKKRKNKREKRHTSINSLQWWILLWTINSEYIFDVLFANHLNFERKTVFNFVFIDSKKNPNNFHLPRKSILIWSNDEILTYQIQYHGSDLIMRPRTVNIIRDYQWNETKWNVEMGRDGNITSLRNVLDLSNTKICCFFSCSFLIRLNWIHSVVRYIVSFSWFEITFKRAFLAQDPRHTIYLFVFCSGLFFFHNLFWFCK